MLDAIATAACLYAACTIASGPEVIHPAAWLSGQLSRGSGHAWRCLRPQQAAEDC